MPNLSKVVALGTSDPSEIVSALRELHDAVRRLPDVELYSREGTLAIPMRFPTRIRFPHAVILNVRNWPEYGVSTGAVGLSWSFNPDLGEIEVHAIDGATSGGSYHLDFVVYGSSV